MFRTTYTIIWGLLALGTAACSDSGLLVAEGDRTTGGVSSGTAGTTLGTGASTNTSGVSSIRGGSSSDTRSDSSPSGGGGQLNSTSGTSQATGGSNAGGSNSGTGGAIQSTGGRNTGSQAPGGSNVGGSTQPNGGSNVGGTTQSMGGTHVVTSSSAGAAGGTSASTVCSGDSCCAGVEAKQDGLSIYLVDGKLYFDLGVALVSGGLDLYTWLTTAELTSAATGVLSGAMSRAASRGNRDNATASLGATSSAVTCGQTLTVQLRVRTDVTNSTAPVQCAGTWGPSVTMTASVLCPTCPADAAADDAGVCVYPRALECPGIVYGMSGEKLTAGCPCGDVYGTLPRRWMCPHT